MPSHRVTHDLPDAKHPGYSCSVTRLSRIPFFHALGKQLRAAGCQVWRVGFNAGDRAFWFDPASYIPYASAPPKTGLKRCATALRRQANHRYTFCMAITRDIHAQAVDAVQGARHSCAVSLKKGIMRPSLGDI